jgi:hypothetical protein
MGAVLFDRPDGLNDDHIFLIGHRIDIRPGQIGKKAFRGNKSVHIKASRGSEKVVE